MLTAAIMACRLMYASQSFAYIRNMMLLGLAFAFSPVLLLQLWWIQVGCASRRAGALAWPAARLGQPPPRAGLQLPSCLVGMRLGGCCSPCVHSSACAESCNRMRPWLLLQALWGIWLANAAVNLWRLCGAAWLIHIRYMQEFDASCPQQQQQQPAELSSEGAEPV